MNIVDLKVIQSGLREYDQLSKMVEFVRNEGIYSREVLDAYNESAGANLIVLTRFEDGTIFIHDGHHRVASVWLSGTRDFLYPHEFTFKDSTYAKYIAPNFQIGWYTPFDPRTHVRVPDFFDFKDEVGRLAAHDENAALSFIEKNRDRYMLNRGEINNISTILDTSLLTTTM